MKIFFLSLIGLLLCSLVSFSQGISIGLKAGWTNSFIKLRTEYPEITVITNSFYPREFFPGVTGGIEGNIPLKKRISFETEILFPHPTKKPSSSVIYAENYLQFPQMIRYNLSLKKKSENSVYAEAGTYFGFLLVKTPFSGIGGPNRFDWGVCGEAGFLHSFGNSTLDLNVRYQRSIFSLVPKRTLDLPNPIGEIEPTMVSAYNQGFSIAIGYSFYLKFMESWLQKNKHRH